MADGLEKCLPSSFTIAVLHFVTPLSTAEDPIWQILVEGITMFSVDSVCASEKGLLLQIPMDRRAAPG